MDQGNDYDFSITNEELLGQCALQNNEALRELFRRHERPVYSFLFRMLSNHEDAEEALAEVFVKVWKGSTGFKRDSKFTTWLYRIASNTAYDILRSRKSRQSVSSIEDVIVNELEISKYSAPNMGDPVHSMLALDTKAQIIKAMNNLSEEDRQLIVLYHFQEYDYDDIVRITDISPSNLKVKLFRARQRLKKLCMEQEREVTENEMRSNTA